MSLQEQSLATSKKDSSLFTTGLALFSMFFGAGNLIFPLLIGKSVGENVWLAILGLGITAVAVPFLGLATMILFRADYYAFFGRIGKIPGLALLLLLQLILGPVGVIPRLVTLMHATAAPYLFDISILPFSILAAALIFICSYQRNRLITLLGLYLTPLLLLSLAALFFFALLKGGSLQPSSASASGSFLAGLVGGYNTMDLIAAFLFATVVLPHFEKGAPSKQSLLKKIVSSSLIAALLLFLTYVGLCLISAYHGHHVDPSLPSEQLLAVLSVQLLGPVGGALAALAVMTACLTTAITLVAIFAEYMRKDLSQQHMTPKTALLLTLVITTLFANLGFSGLTAFLGPILQIVYPGLILLTFLNLLYILYGYRMVKTPLFFAFVSSALVYILAL